MKKLISLLLVVMILALSGCEGSNYDRAINPDKYIEYYTQEEVDSLLRQQNIEIRQDLMQYYVQSYDGKLYTNCRIEDSIKVCDEINIKVD